MLRLRRLDEEGLRDYLDDLRPRFVTLRIRANNVRLWWGMPLWPLEEMLGFALRLAPLLPWLAPRLPEKVRRALPPASEGAGGPDAWDVLEALFGQTPRDMLRLPPGEVFVSVETDQADIEIRQH